MRKLTGTRNQSEGDLLTGSEALPLVRRRQLHEDGEYKEEAFDAEEFHALYVVVRRRHESRHGRHEIVVISHLRHEKGFPALRIIPLGPVRQQSTSPGRALPGLDRTQYRFGVQKRQGSFRMERKSNPDGNCHHRLVLPLGLPRPNQEQIFEITNV
ncbi:hypothetical protein YC2023_008634 [Brassica napus]